MNDQGIMLRFIIEPKYKKKNICCTPLMQVFKREETFGNSSNFIRVYIYLASMDMALLVIKIWNASEIAAALSPWLPSYLAHTPTIFDHLENKALRLGQHLPSRNYGTAILVCCRLDNNGVKYFKCNLWMEYMLPFFINRREYVCRGRSDMITVVFCLSVFKLQAFTHLFPSTRASLSHPVPGYH